MLLLDSQSPAMMIFLAVEIQDSEKAMQNVVI